MGPMVHLEEKKQCVSFDLDGINHQRIVFEPRSPLFALLPLLFMFILSMCMALC